MASAASEYDILPDNDYFGDFEYCVRIKSPDGEWDFDFYCGYGCQGYNFWFMRNGADYIPDDADDLYAETLQKLLVQIILSVRDWQFTDLMWTYGMPCIEWVTA